MYMGKSVSVKTCIITYYTKCHDKKQTFELYMNLIEVTILHIKVTIMQLHALMYTQGTDMILSAIQILTTSDENALFA